MHGMYVYALHLWHNIFTGFLKRCMTKMILSLQTFLVGFSGDVSLVVTFLCLDFASMDTFK